MHRDSVEERPDATAHQRSQLPPARKLPVMKGDAPAWPCQQMKAYRVAMAIRVLYRIVATWVNALVYHAPVMSVLLAVMDVYLFGMARLAMMGTHGPEGMFVARGFAVVKGVRVSNLPCAARNACQRTTKNRAMTETPKQV